MHAFRTAARSDHAISPVIATTMMVATTIAVTAFVYLWIAQTAPVDALPAKHFALRPEGPTVAAGPGDHTKTYMITAASGGALYRDIDWTLDGAWLAPDLGAACEPSVTERWAACAGAVPRGADDLMRAGDMITLRTSDAPDGLVLRLIDPEANSVVYSIVVQ